MLEIVILFAVLVGLVALYAITKQLTRIENKLMNIRIDSDTLNSLVSLAESAVAADAHDKADLAALQSTVANETDLPTDLKARIDALITPPAAAAPTA